MKRLTQENFKRARSYLGRSGRPVDWARFLLHFENGEAAQIAGALACYQNDDGGFGFALEPDLRTSLSSAVATCQALKLFAEAKLPGSHPVVRQTLAYLQKSFDRERGIWPIAPEGLKKSSHAPWWGGVDVVADFGGCLANPRAQIVGALLSYRVAFDETLLKKILESTLQHLASLPDKMEMHDLLCYLDLMRAPQLADSLKEEMRPKLRRAIEVVVTRDSAKWSGYAVKPLLLCRDLDEARAAGLEAETLANLEYELNRQSADGGWAANWSWEAQDAGGWHQAQREWSGQLTVESLLTFRRFFCIEGA